MLHVWIEEALYDRIRKCLELFFRKIQSLHELAVHDLSYELTDLRVFDALLHSIES